METKNDEMYDKLENENKIVERKAIRLVELQERIERLGEWIKEIDRLSGEVDEETFKDENKKYYTMLNKAGDALFHVVQGARKEQHDLKVKYIDEVGKFNTFLKRYGVFYPYDYGYRV